MRGFHYFINFLLGRLRLDILHKGGPVKDYRTLAGHLVLLEVVECDTAGLGSDDQALGGARCAHLRHLIIDKQNRRDLGDGDAEDGNDVLASLICAQKCQ